MNRPGCFFDFHTHHRPERCAAAIVSVTELPPEPGIYSLMLHPWHLPDRFAGLPPGWREQAGLAAAIGEIGLDRLRGPELPVQVRYLESALEVAVELDKPVIVHCVRCRSELLAVFRRYPVRNKLIHGFAGGVRAWEEYRREGFRLSLGRRGVESEVLRPLLRRLSNWACLGLESDDEPGGVEELYRRATELAGPELPQILETNFRTFLGLDA